MTTRTPNAIGPVLFTPSEIEALAHPSCRESGRRLIDTGNGPVTLQMVATDIVASFRGKQAYSTVISRKSGHPIEFACTCGFGCGSACEHVVAVMLAVNAREAIQTGLDLTVSASPASVSTRPMDDRPAPPASAEPVETVGGTPRPRLYLSESGGLLLAELRFAYGDAACEVRAADRSREKLSASPDGTVVRVERSIARELHWTTLLQEADLTHYRSGVYTPCSGQTDWVRDTLPRLTAAGFDIFGRENLMVGITRVTAPSMKLTVTQKQCGIIECTVNAAFGGIGAHLDAIFDAIIAGNRYIPLSNGSRGEIPREWIDRLAVVFALCEKRPEGNRLVMRASQMAALESLASAGDAVSWNAVCAAGRKRIDDLPQASTALLPRSFKGELRSYQLAGFQWMHSLQKHGIGGCLADDMGLGKTVQTLCLLLYEKECAAVPRTSLLVVPTSLVCNWQREAKRFCPSLLLMNYHGPDRKRYRFGDMALADLVLTTYGTLLREAEKLSRMAWNYVIIDEAQSIKNPLSLAARTVRQLSARHRLALSGTPFENSLSELWSLFAFLNPGMLGPYTRFASTFIRPIEKERNEPRIAVLRDLTRPCLLRRTKAQVATELPPKTEVLRTLPLLPRQRALYDMTKDAYRARIMQIIDTEGMDRGRMHALQALTRLRQICCHPRLVDPLFKGDSCKFVELDSLIDTIVVENHKALLFSPFVTALDLIRERLRERNVRHEYLTGATADRQKPVDAFQADDAVSLMLISLKAGGVGLNLTAADYVILFDPWWNPAVENQAADRAYRIGQTRPVFVYKLIAQDTLEERVLELQQSKKELFDAIITPESTMFREMKPEDLRRLFE